MDLRKERVAAKYNPPRRRELPREKTGGEESIFS